jgi:uncharacterized protein YndB with AHSA1/START domain
MTKTSDKVSITVRVDINTPVEKVWKLWTNPFHIIHWNNATDTWHTPRAENDLRVGGKFLSRMEAKDGSAAFDFNGEYTFIEPYKQIQYILEDDRKVDISFVAEGKVTKLTEKFDAEQLNSIELQREGWQAILDNFKRYAEANGKMEAMHFEIYINAPVDVVFHTMLDEKKYNLWTAEFNPSSHFKGSWEKGSKILFLGTDSNGKIGGMVSRIKENIHNKFVSIQHIGIIQDGKEITSGPEVDSWAGALENYTFKDENGKTLLIVDVDSNQEFMNYFTETWPKALKKLKEICEK